MKNTCPAGRGRLQTSQTSENKYQTYLEVSLNFWGVSLETSIRSLSTNRPSPETASQIPGEIWCVSEGARPIIPIPRDPCSPLVIFLEEVEIRSWKCEFPKPESPAFQKLPFSGELEPLSNFLGCIFFSHPVEFFGVYIFFPPQIKFGDSPCFVHISNNITAVPPATRSAAIRPAVAIHGHFQSQQDLKVCHSIGCPNPVWGWRNLQCFSIHFEV